MEMDEAMLERMFGEIFRTVMGERDETTHTHRCLDCSREWSHKGKDITSQEENTRAHTCPGCNAPQYWVHRFEGDDRSAAEIDKDFIERNREKPYGCNNPWAGKYNFRGMRELKEAA